MASEYIIAYDAYMTTGSGGSVSVTFQITGTNVMDQIGATKITLFENGAVVKTFQNTNYAGMLINNKNSNAGTLTYPGTAGKLYYASVILQAGKGGAFDTRTKETASVTARN